MTDAVFSLKMMIFDKKADPSPEFDFLNIPISKPWEKSKKQGQNTKVIGKGVRKIKFEPPADWPKIKYAKKDQRKKSSRSHYQKDGSYRKNTRRNESSKTISGRAGKALSTWKNDRRK